MLFPSECDFFTSLEPTSTVANALSKWPCGLGHGDLRKNPDDTEGPSTVYSLIGVCISFHMFASFVFFHIDLHLFFICFSPMLLSYVFHYVFVCFSQFSKGVHVFFLYVFPFFVSYIFALFHMFFHMLIFFMKFNISLTGYRGFRSATSQSASKSSNPRLRSGQLHIVCSEIRVSTDIDRHHLIVFRTCFLQLGHTMLGVLLTPSLLTQ